MDQMKNIDIVALPAEEFKAHLDKVFNLMNAADIDYAIIRDNANLYYLTGRVFRGYIYLDAKTSGYAFGVKAPNNLSGDNLMYFRKPADFVEHVVAKIWRTRNFGLRTRLTSLLKRDSPCQIIRRNQGRQHLRRYAPSSFYKDNLRTREDSPQRC